MTYVVAFDNSPLSQAALDRAATFASAIGENVVAVTAVPKDPAVASERGWLRGDESFNIERVTENLAAAVREVAPEARLEYSVVDKHAPRGRLARAVRDLAVDNDARVVFIGSENAGRIVGGITSVGQTVTADDRYDVHVVRHLATDW
jgi:nucleotide-binding universal stress UspA family protein